MAPVEESHRQYSTEEKLKPDLCHGNKLANRNSLKILTGETRMESTTSDGLRTNISQSTVDHAGPKDPLLLLEIDSTSSWKI